MRVLLVSHGFPPGAMGGTEVYVRDLARSLVRQHSDRVVVFAREADPARPEYEVRRFETEGIELVLVNNTFRECRSFQQTYRNPVIRAIAAELFDAFRPEVAHLHHLTCLSTDLVDELHARQIPTLVTLHDYWLLCQRGQLLDLDYQRCDGPTRDGCARCLGLTAGASPAMYRGARLLKAVEHRLPPPMGKTLRSFAEELAGKVSDPLAAGAQIDERLRHVREVCDRVDLLLAPSETVRQQFLRFGVAAEKLRPTALGIDLSGHASQPQVPRTGPLRVGFLGSLMVSKAPHLLLEAFAQLPLGSATVHLYGAHTAYHGDTRYRAVVEALSQRDGVTMGGQMEHGQVPALLRSLDVLVAPSIWLENSPLVIREAFAAGVPVVGSNLGGIAEQVEHGHNGLLFQPGSATDLARSLRRLLDEPELLPHLRRGLPEVRSIDDDARETRELYRQLQDRRPPAASRRTPRVPSDASTPPKARRSDPPPGTLLGLAAVVLNYRTPEHTIRCVQSLEGGGTRPEWIVVVDNGSKDGSTAQMATALPAAIHLEADRNLGFSGGNNLGIRRALSLGAERILLLNSDVEVPAGCLTALSRSLDLRPEVGIVGPMVLDPATGQVESRGIGYSRSTGRMRCLGAEETPDVGAGTPRVDAISGCAMMVRREVWEEVGLLDERYFYSFEDLDFCLRAQRLGFETRCVLEARVLHLGSATIGRGSEDRLYYGARNHLLLNATLTAPGKSLAHWLRAAAIIGVTLGHSLARSEVPRRRGLRAVGEGVWHHARKRYGARS